MKSELIEAIKSSLLVGALAGTIRVFIHPDKNWKEKIFIFILSVTIGVLLGILVQDLQIDNMYKSSIIAAGSLLGKETMQTLIDYTPKLVRTYIKGKFDKINNKPKNPDEQ
jgi:hypothetical protein